MQLKQLKTTNDKVDFHNRTALAWTNYCYTKPVNIVQFFFALGLAIPILKLGIVFYIHLHFQLLITVNYTQLKLVSGILRQVSI